MNKKSTLLVVGVILVCGGALTGLGYFEKAVCEAYFQQGRSYERDILQNAAIAAKVASWSINEKTGQTSFIFLKPVEPEIFQQKAIAAKIAKWFIHDETGEKSFQFLTPKGLEPLPMPKKEAGGISVQIPLPPKE